MATYVGFNTINQYKKFTLVDSDLIKRDFLNSLNIRQGQVPGRPAVGTTLWDMLFEIQDRTTEEVILNEIQRAAGIDPRIYIDSVKFYPQQNGMLIEVEVRIIPSNNAEQLSIFFDQQQRVASYV